MQFHQKNVKYFEIEKLEKNMSDEELFKLSPNEPKLHKYANIIPSDNSEKVNSEMNDYAIVTFWEKNE